MTKEIHFAVLFIYINLDSTSSSIAKEKLSFVPGTIKLTENVEISCELIALTQEIIGLMYTCIIHTKGFPLVVNFITYPTNATNAGEVLSHF